MDVFSSKINNIFIFLIAPLLLTGSIGQLNHTPKLKFVNTLSSVNVKTMESVIVVCKCPEKKPGMRLLWTNVNQRHLSDDCFESWDLETSCTLHIQPPLMPSMAKPYTCVLFDEQNKALASKTINVTLYSPENDCTLNITEVKTAHKYSNILPRTVRQNDDAIWNITIESEQPIIMEQEYSPYVLNYKSKCVNAEETTYHCQFLIKSVQVATTGTYVIDVSNGRVVKKINIDLKVLPAIDVALTGIPDLYAKGSLTNPVCVVSGIGWIEQNMVKWDSILSFSECDGEMGNSCKAVNINLVSNGIRRTRGRGRVFLNLDDFSPKKSGVLRCSFPPQFEHRGIKPVEAKVCLTDGPEELTKHNEDKLEPGASARISCELSHCNYNSTMGIRWFYEQNVKENSVGEKPIVFGATVANGIMSTRSTLELKTVVVGSYTCMGQPLGKNKAAQIFIVEAKDRSIITYTSLGLLASISLMLICMLIYQKWRQRQELIQRNLVELLNLRDGDETLINGEQPLHNQAALLTFDSSWEFPRDKLKLKRQLGAGFFGVVMLADAEGIVAGEERTSVAVKTARCYRNHEVMAALVGELKIMSHMGRHPFIVNLLGAVVDRLAENQLMIIVELCSLGNLSDYLSINVDNFIDFKKPKVTDDGKPFNTSVLMEWSFQVARGMEWLASKRVLHGDLAARNVLLTEHHTVKISDFGLSRSMYYDYQREKNANARLPVKWMALESLRERKFSIKSDVWSYGVLLWEMFSLAATPYPAFNCFTDIWNALNAGYRMEKPEHAPQEIYDVMCKCWKADPRLRPSFSQLSGELFQLLESCEREKCLKQEEEMGCKSNGDRDYVNLAIFGRLQ